MHLYLHQYLIERISNYQKSESLLKWYDQAISVRHSNYKNSVKEIWRQTNDCTLQLTKIQKNAGIGEHKQSMFAKSESAFQLHTICLNMLSFKYRKKASSITMTLSKETLRSSKLLRCSNPGITFMARMSSIDCGCILIGQQLQYVWECLVRLFAERRVFRCRVIFYVDWRSTFRLLARDGVAEGDKVCFSFL